MTVSWPLFTIDAHASQVELEARSCSREILFEATPSCQRQYMAAAIRRHSLESTQTVAPWFRAASQPNTQGPVLLVHLLLTSLKLAYWVLLRLHHLEPSDCLGIYDQAYGVAFSLSTFSRSSSAVSLAYLDNSPPSLSARLSEALGFCQAVNMDDVEADMHLSDLEDAEIESRVCIT